MDKQGKLYVWKNNENKEIVVMITDTGKGVVVHSDNLISIGTMIDVDISYNPFVGTVNIVSKEES